MRSDSYFNFPAPTITWVSCSSGCLYRRLCCNKKSKRVTTTQGHFIVVFFCVTLWAQFSNVVVVVVHAAAVGGMWRTSDSLYAPGPGRPRSTLQQHYHSPAPGRSQRRQSHLGVIQTTTGRWVIRAPPSRHGCHGQTRVQAAAASPSLEQAMGPSTCRAGAELEHGSGDSKQTNCGEHPSATHLVWHHTGFTKQT
jgi:hypothetical protein